MNDSPIVIFGGNGYLGNALATTLVERKRNVIIADLSDSNVSSSMHFSRVDICNANEVLAAIPEGAIVINYAGIADLNKAKEMPSECLAINVMGNCNILNGCVQKKVQKYAYASSAYVYSQHGSFYRISKRTCEEYVVEYGKKYALPYLVFRYGSLYGGASNESNGMHRLVASALQNGTLHYDGFKSDRREFIHVSDASEITADLLTSDDVNQALVLTGAESFTMEELFALIAEITNKPITTSFANDPKSDHYHMTQYNFVPIQAKKMTNLRHIDLGNGIMDLVNSIYVESQKRIKV
jgi:UDP-glucose 4-epimerase